MDKNIKFVDYIDFQDFKDKTGMNGKDAITFLITEIEKKMATNNPYISKGEVR